MTGGAGSTGPTPVWVDRTGRVDSCPDSRKAATVASSSSNAQKSNILRASIAANAIGLVVVELESLARRAASAVRGLKRALTSVALPHEAPYRGGDTAHTGRRVGFLKTFSRVFRLAEALGFEPFELLRDGRFHNGSEVAARHERLEYPTRSRPSWPSHKSAQPSMTSSRTRRTSRSTSADPPHRDSKNWVPCAPRLSL